MTEKFSVVILSSNRIPLIPKKVGLNKPDLKKFDTKKSTTLDWIINTLSLYNFKKIEVVLGNDFEKTRKLNYPKVSFNNNLYWNKFGNLYSLSLVLNKIKGKCLISYGDIVFNNNALDKLLSYSDSDFVIGFDSTWRTRYVKRSKLSYKKVELISEQNNFLKKIFKGYKLDENVIGEFCGLFLVSGDGNEIISKILTKIQENNNNLNIENSSIIDLLNYLILKKMKIKVVDISGEWSEMDSVNDFKSFIFRGKADTLANLENNLKNAEILPQVSFTIDEWKNKKSEILKKILKKNWPSLVVRSSGIDEDGQNYSLAGQYTSLLNIANLRKDVILSVQNVISVMIKKGKNLPKNYKKNKVLIQPFLSKTNMNGVAFSCDIKNGSPYFVINFDENNDTEGVTSGKSKTQKITYIARSKKIDLSSSTKFKKLINLILELEEITGSLVDIEFGIQNNKLYLFQVRPLIINKAGDNFIKSKIKFEIASTKRSLNKLFKKRKKAGDCLNVLSDMTDWNPAEMIGVHPKPLSMSLYKYLITNKTWALARKKIGYKDLSSNKLMISLAGHPYINVKNSFNSLIPNGIPNKLSEKLVNYYLEKLEESTYLHDKVEFEILFSCYTPKTEQDLKLLKIKGFSNNEIKVINSNLKKLTLNILENPKLSIKSVLEEIGVLENNYQIFLNKPQNYDYKTILKSCIKYGILPFAILARYAFIASKIFKDMASIGLLSNKNINKFFNNIQTIASEGSETFGEVQKGQVSIDHFLKRFGHLRPGTYDLLQQRYDEAPNKYFKVKKIKMIKPLKKKTNKQLNSNNYFDEIELINIQNYLNSLSTKLTASDLIKFASESIKAREYSKFQFTKTISHSLELFKKFAKHHQIKLNDIVFLNVEEILQWAYQKNDMALNNKMKNKIFYRKSKYQVHKEIKLPSLIQRETDIENFTIFYDKPNFITEKLITSECIYVRNLDEEIDIQDKIVLIDNADPGFDWIFTHNIKGLVTKFGGVASHMSIRCNEFSLPAAIGCGELLFENIINKRIITIDCANEMIKGH